jgi:hypothetical protein
MLHSFVGDGQENCANQIYSTIVGGCCNATNAQFTGVLGGALNNACCNYAGIFGCSITNDCACSFMSNCLRACNIFGAGAICANAGGTIVPTTSDCRLKKDICGIGYGLCQVLCLNPISFNWNDKQDNGCARQLGFIAQEVKQIIPEAVFNTVSGYYGLDMNKIVPVLTSAIQEMKSCNDTMKSCQDAMNLEIENLKAIINRAGLA